MIDRLYEIIGGRRMINSAVELFYQKVLADESVKHFFDGVDMEHLRTRQSMFVTMLLGGEFVYTGRDIREAHARPRLMGMTDPHFETLLRHFRAALEELGVPPDKVEQVMMRVQGTRKDVLDRPQ